MNTKRQSVLNHLILFGSITQKEAADRYDAWRLSSIIYRLKGNGHKIRTQAEKHENGTHARYIYEGEV